MSCYVDQDGLKFTQILLLCLPTDGIKHLCDQAPDTGILGQKFYINFPCQDKKGGEGARERQKGNIFPFKGSLLKLRVLQSNGNGGRLPD